ncbi:biotin-dependent carboxyltransferase family protein [Bacillus tianshenii]|nr:biotin-dependent carboxyltransferase family protein [Bacillus tianshenii]
MTQPLFDVLKAGMLTTVQDRGRYGYQEYGVGPAGAMDEFSLQLGNILLGNERNAAGLEITMMGPELKALSDTVIAITGGDLSPSIDGQKVETWKSIEIKKDQVLAFGSPKTGIRAYLCVAGGFHVPEIMQSRSTYMKASLGGYEGRALEKGDRLNGFENSAQQGLIGRLPHYDLIPAYEKDVTLRVIEGPHHQAFTNASVETFFSTPYKVTPQADRMGYRLEGATLKHIERADIISEAIPFGGIQVPANGQPIILMADRQTTGGYTRIGTIISVDLPLTAQLKPGNTVSFERISIEQAQALYREREQLLRTLEKVE